MGDFIYSASFDISIVGCSQGLQQQRLCVEKRHIRPTSTRSSCRNGQLIRLGVLLCALLLWNTTSVVAQAFDASHATAAQLHQQLNHRTLAPDLQRTLQHAKQALQAAQEIIKAPLIAAARLRLGQAYYTLRRPDEAVRHIIAALHYYQQTNNRRRVATTQYVLGSAQFSQGDTGKARETYLLAMQAFTVARNPAGIARGRELLGKLYASEAQWPQALKSHEQALLAWQQAGNDYQTIVALNNIGLVHRQQRHFSRALYYLQRAYRLAVQQQDSTCTGQALTSIGQVYQAMNNQEVAASFYTQALTYLPPATAPGYVAELLQSLATAQDSIGNPEQAVIALQEALRLARQASTLQQVSSVYYSLANHYQFSNQHQASLEALRHYADLQDSVFTEQRSAQVAELRTRYETEKKEREIQLLTKDRQIQVSRLHEQQLQRNILLVGTVALLVLASVLYRSRRRHQHLNALLKEQNTAIQAQRDELGLLNRTKNTLFSVISHDLRSPLGSLYSMLSLLNMGALPPERLAVHSERLSRMLDTTLRLLDNLLNWSAAQMAGEATRPESVYLDEAVEETLSLLLGDAERKKIDLLNQVQEPYIAYADLNMIRLVLRNLVSNAIKFTPSAGTVTVTARRLGTMWEIAVTDSGLGITAADRQKIFGQGGPHSTLGTAHEKGTGLGLLLCKDFVERNGGLLTFESEPGQGTTFRFTLPAFAQQLRVEQAVSAAAG